MKSKLKRISALSVAVMVMGGTIGAGIFFKNKTLSRMAQGDFGIVLATWGIGILAMLALAIAIIEVSSAQKTNSGSLEWVQLFCPKWLYHSSSFYIRIIFIPITLFTVPLYLTNSLEDAGLPLAHSEGLALLFSFGVFIWFMLVNLISLRYVEIAQWIFTIIQTIPLIIFPILGFINAGEGIEGTIWNKDVEPLPGLTGTSPWLGTIAGISAIAFAFDGFYAYASLRNEMEKPEKNGWGLAIGVIGISIIYLFLTIGVNMAGTGAVDGLASFVNTGVYKMLSAFIAVAIMGVVNNYTMSSIRQLKDVNLSNAAPELKWIQKLIYRAKYSKDNQKQNFFAAWTWILLATTFLFATLGSIGAFAYNLSTYGTAYAGSHIYSFADVLTNFTSLLVFLIIAFCVLGAIINRKTKKVKVQKNMLFLPSAFISITIIFIGSLYMIVEAVVGATGFNNADAQSNVINLIIFLILIFSSLFVGLNKSYNFIKWSKTKNRQKR